MGEQVLIGPRVFAQDRTYDRGYVACSDGRIDEVGAVGPAEPARRPTDLDGDHVLRLPPEYTLVPGRIDLHVHGADGADTMDATPDALRTIAAALPREGTTSFLPTTITASMDRIDAATRNVGEFIETQQRPGVAEVLGVHLEGPFIAPEMAGAHPTEHVTEPDLELFEHWQSTSDGTITMVVLAPEIGGALETATALSQAGVVASIGHSNATYDEASEAVEAGFSHVTHLFNRMRGLHHREPGVVGAALLRDDLTTELVADGVHVRPEVVRLAYETIGADRLILVTDSMRAKGVGPGTHDFGGRPVSVSEGEARLSDGTLAGSVLRMDRAIENVMNYTKCSMREAIRMSSENPAKRLGVFDRKGGLRAGKDADVVVLDGENRVVLTLCRGTVAHCSEPIDTPSWS